MKNGLANTGSVDSSSVIVYVSPGCGLSPVTRMFGAGGLESDLGREMASAIDSGRFCAPSE